jgi:hypothetical protein
MFAPLWSRLGDAPDRDLRWFRHDGRTDDSDRWTGPKRVGRQRPAVPHRLRAKKRCFQDTHDVALIANREESGRYVGQVVALNRQVEPSDTRQESSRKRSTTCPGSTGHAARRGSLPV